MASEYLAGRNSRDQARADERIPILLSIPAAKHFVSVEPMLEPVSLAGFAGKLIVRGLILLLGRLLWIG